MSDDFSYIILQNSSFGYKVRLMFRLTKTVLLALWPLSAMLLFLSQCFGNMNSLVEGKTDESEFILYLGMLLCFLLISIVVIIMIPSVIVLTNDIVEGREIRAWTQIIREGISNIGKLIVTTLVILLIPISIFILLTGLQFVIALMSNFLSKSNNFAVNLFIHQVTSSTWLSNLFGFILIFIYRIYWGFYPYAVVINQQVGWQALKISYRRLKGRWLDVVVQDFALSLVLGTLVFLILFIVSLPFFDIETRFQSFLIYIPFTVAYIIFQLLLFKSYDTSAEATTPASTISNNDTTLNNTSTYNTSTYDTSIYDTSTYDTSTYDNR